jgi:myo-inositol-1(or 4)-monophosphatase
MEDQRSLESDLSVARQLAEQAGEIIKSRWGTVLQIEHKGVVDLVSEVDLAAEAHILKGLHQLRPNDAVLAEEASGEHFDRLGHHLSSEAGRVWCIDPLDGTTNFSHGLPHFCVSIALLVGGQAQVAVIHEPLRSWTFYATKTQGAWLNGRLLRVSEETELEQALLATGFPYDRHTSNADNIDQTSTLLKRCQGIRRAGSAALDLAYVAAGWLDGYWEYKLKPWDIAAGALIVQEAGGMVTDTDGGSGWLKSGTLVTAANATLHQSIFNCLAASK